MADENLITIDDLPAEIISQLERGKNSDSGLDSENLVQLEKRHIIDILEQKKGNKAQAAKVLGIHRRKLYRLIKRYGIGVSK